MRQNVGKNYAQLAGVLESLERAGLLFLRAWVSAQVYKINSGHDLGFHALNRADEFFKRAEHRAHKRAHKRAEHRAHKRARKSLSRAHEVFGFLSK